jgi:hypothetical protein
MKKLTIKVTLLEKKLNSIYINIIFFEKNPNTNGFIYSTVIYYLKF